jgi:D-proline reductase (dithiol) PrdB
MARTDDIPEPTRSATLALAITAAPSQPFVAPRPLSSQRVALVSSAALIRRGDAPFPAGSGEFRVLPTALPAGELLMSHVSINFDRSGWQHDVNTIYPIDRLRELAAEGLIGSVADAHYSVMGSTDPRAMAESAAAIAQAMHAEGVSAVLLSPV